MWFNDYYDFAGESKMMRWLTYGDCYTWAED